MKARTLIRFLLCLLIPLAAGGLSGIATVSAIPGWYAGLVKASFNPPDYIFGPVWTFLYILMGISLYLIWIAPKGPARDVALAAFGLQLLLNFAWSFLFFYFHQTGWALVEIILLWVTIIMMIQLFYRVRRAAAWLQVPYLLWVAFATVLNASIWHLN
jgi:benzodiazapine receptor